VLLASFIFVFLTSHITTLPTFHKLIRKYKNSIQFNAISQYFFLAVFESRGFFHLDNPFYICLKYYFWSFAVGGGCPLSILFIGVSKPIIIPSGISFLYMSEKLYLSVKKWLGSFSLWVCFGLLKIKASNGRSVLIW